MKAAPVVAKKQQHAALVMKPKKAVVPLPPKKESLAEQIDQVYDEIHSTKDDPAAQEESSGFIG